MKVSLVIMAAGLGSRYGGSKQVDGIGPHHEILMEYSVYDAIRAGFNKVVFIIKPEMETMMHELCGEYLAKKWLWAAALWRGSMHSRIFPPCRVLHHSAGANQALWHDPRAAVRGGCGPRALLRHQCG